MEVHLWWMSPVSARMSFAAGSENPASANEKGDIEAWAPDPIAFGGEGCFQISPTRTLLVPSIGDIGFLTVGT